MKAAILLITAVLGSTPVFAKSESSKLPANLICTSTVKDSEISKFEITKLNTEAPDSTIPDTGLLELNIDKNKYLVDLSFSNECDNSYGLVFFYDDLIKLQSKKIKKVTAILNYSNADMTNESEEQYSSTVSVECVLK